ncbi:type I-E CRISPR-associated protein Cse1/CasA [Streptomyces albidoflavus]
MSDPLIPLDRWPWVPVRWSEQALADAGGDLPAALGLREVLEHSHDIVALDIAEPPLYAATQRVLYALTARVTGLDEEDPGDWSGRRLEVLEAGRLPAQGIAAYFDRWAHRFLLHDAEGGRPWMQDSRLAQQCDAQNTAGVNKLTLSRASGGNHSWWVHTQDSSPVPLDAGEAVLNMLGWHFYGPSGKGSSRDVNGLKTNSMKAGPLRGAMSYHPEGQSLFVSLLAGLLRPQAAVRREEDLCPWERPDLPDPDAVPPALSGPCSRLTAVSHHAVLLLPDHQEQHKVGDAFITWAYRTASIPREDPYLIWQVSQAGNAFARPADAGRALWRDLDALLLAEAGGRAQPRRPAVFDWAIELSDELDTPLAVRALGFAQEREQVRDIVFVSGLTPPVLAHAERDNASTAPAVGQLRRLGELYGRRVVYAVRRAHILYSGEEKAKETEAWQERAGAAYWPRAEREFWDRFRTLDRERGARPEAGLDAKATQKAFRRLAFEVYDEVTAPVCHTLRGAKAVAAARMELFGPRPKTKGPTKPGEAMPADTPTPRAPVPAARTAPEPDPPATDHPDEAGPGTPAARPSSLSSSKAARYRAYVRWVEKVCAEDPGARVALRQGAGRGRKEVATMHRIVAPWLPEQRDDVEERAFYAVAAMIANRPRHTFQPASGESPDETDRPTPQPAPGAGTASAADTGIGATNSTAEDAGTKPRSSLGAAYARAVNDQLLREDSAEARLDLLTRQSLNGLHRHLPSSMRHLRQAGTDVDFAVLLADLTWWPTQSKTIARRWLQDFYRLRDAAKQGRAQQRDDDTSDNAPDTD